MYCLKMVSRGHRLATLKRRCKAIVNERKENKEKKKKCQLERTCQQVSNWLTPTRSLPRTITRTLTPPKGPKWDKQRLYAQERKKEDSKNYAENERGTKTKRADSSIFYRILPPHIVPQLHKIGGMTAQVCVKDHQKTRAALKKQKAEAQEEY